MTILKSFANGGNVGNVFVSLANALKENFKLPPFRSVCMSDDVTSALRFCYSISHVLNEQGTGYENSISIELKNGSCHLKEHPKLSAFAKFESYWCKRKGVVHF